MGTEHDVNSEMLMIREYVKQFNSVTTHDSHDGTKTTFEYIVGEGDPPFCKYRLTLEQISTHSADEFESLKDKETATAAEPQAAAE